MVISASGTRKMYTLTGSSPGVFGPEVDLILLSAVHTACSSLPGY